MSWYIAAALILIAGLYLKINWIMYLGVLMLAAPLIILALFAMIAIIGAILS